MLQKGQGLSSLWVDGSNWEVDVEVELELELEVEDGGDGRCEDVTSLAEAIVVLFPPAIGGFDGVQ